MGWFDDRSTPEFKAKEEAFYGECEVYTSRIEDCRKIEDSNDYNITQSEKEEAHKKRIELENERQELVDKWKEENGAYDHDKAYNTRIDGSRIPDKQYENYTKALEEQKAQEAECDSEEDYEM